MRTISTVVIVGNVEGEPDRKTVNGKALADFHVEGVSLRISAWETAAANVPGAGTPVIVNGYLRTRTYTYEGAERTSTEITATSVQPVVTSASDEPF